MPLLRVAVVGLGHNGCAWVRGYEASQRAELVALCDLSEEKITEAKELAPDATGYADLDEMLEKEELDVLSVHTPDHLHAEPFVKGLEAGRHVLVEKPMGNTMEDLERMVAAARRSDRKTHVGQILRFNPFFAKVKELCADGTLGEIFYMEADYIHNLLYQAAAERFNPDLANVNWYLEHEKPIVGGGVHPLDLLRWYADSDVVEVDGFGNSIAFPAMRHNDCMVGIFKFESGAVAKVAALYGPVGDMARLYNLAVYGTKGTVRDGQLMVGEGHDVEVTDLSELEIGGHPFEPQLEHFLECIIEDEPTLVDAFSGANSAAATIKAAEAIRTGEKQAVPIYSR